MSEKIEVAATFKATDQATAPIAGITASMEKMKASAHSLAAAMRNMPGVARMRTSFAGLGTSIAAARTSVSAALSPLMGLAGLAGTMSLGTLIGGLKGYVKEASGLLKASQNIGTTVEHLSALHIAAKRMGIDSDEFNSAFRKADMAMAKARAGKGKEVAALFKQMGVSMTDSSGKARSFVDVMPQVADAFANTTNQGTRARMATALFGREYGAKLEPFLRQGSKGIEAAIQQAIKLGVITKQEAEEAKAFSVAQKEVGATLDAVGRSIYATLLPAIKPFLEIVRDLLTENRQDIIQVFRDFGATLKGIDLKSVAADVKVFGSAIWALFKAFGGLYFVAARVAWFFVGPFVKAITTVGAVLFNVMRGMLMMVGMNPILAAITAGLVLFAAAAYLIYQNWDKIGPAFWRIWGVVKAAFWSAIAWLGEFGGKWIWGPIVKGWELLAGWFTANVWPKVKEVFWAAIDWVNEFAGKFIPQPIKDAWNGLLAWAQKLWDDPKAAFWSALDWFRDFYGQFIPQPVKDAWNSLVSWAEQMWPKVKAAFWVAIDWLNEFAAKFIPKPIKDAWAAIEGFFASMWTGIANAFETAWAKIKPIVEFIEGAGRVLGNIAKGAAEAAASVPAVDEYGRPIPGTGPQSVPGAATPSIPGASTAAGRPTAELRGKADVDVHIRTDGTVQTNSSAEGNLNPPNVNTGQSMPQLRNPLRPRTRQ